MNTLILILLIISLVSQLYIMYALQKNRLKIKSLNDQIERMTQDAIDGERSD